MISGKERLYLKGMVEIVKFRSNILKITKTNG
jgi:hypothetical protein